MKQLINRIALAFVCVFTLSYNVSAAQTLIPGGQVVGLELADNTIRIAAFDEKLGDEARSAGLQVGDTIVCIDEQTVTSAEDVRKVLSRSDGSVDVEILRKGKEKELKLTPKVTPDGPRLGIYLKQGVTGVGTVTWYDPDCGKFGCLGHGVNDQSGTLIPMHSGTAYAATVMSVKKGKVGDPGQLLGALNHTAPIGVLAKNTVQGVFGTVDTAIAGQPLPVAQRDQIRTGAATIRSTVQGRTVQEYSVEILKIYPNAKAGGRNMLLRVTDPALLDATGGIVQGMGVSYNKDNQWNP